MSGAVIGGAVAAQYVILSNAIKAYGSIIKIEPSDFIKILQKSNRPLVVETKYGLFSTKYKYLTSYKGLVFHCKSSNPILYGIDVEVVKAKKMSIPDI